MQKKGEGSSFFKKIYTQLKLNVSPLKSYYSLLSLLVIVNVVPFVLSSIINKHNWFVRFISPAYKVFLQKWINYLFRTLRLESFNIQLFPLNSSAWFSFLLFLHGEKLVLKIYSLQGFILKLLCNNKRYSLKHGMYLSDFNPNSNPYI